MKWCAWCNREVPEAGGGYVYRKGRNGMIPRWKCAKHLKKSGGWSLKTGVSSTKGETQVKSGR